MAQFNTKWRSPASSPQRSGSSVISPQGTAPPPEITREAIAKRAYEKFLARGCQDGEDMKDWLQAERELKAEAFKNMSRN